MPLGRLVDGALDRIADLSVRLGVAGDHGRPQGDRGLRVGRPGRLGGSVRARHVDADQAKAILREGSGLVRAHHRYRAERFDRGQPAHHRVAPGHALRSEGESTGDDGRKAFGHRGDGEGDRQQQGVGQGSAQRQADAEQHARQDHGGEGHPSAEPGQSSLQRGGTPVDAAQERREATHRRVRPGRLDPDLAASGDHQRAGLDRVARHPVLRDRLAGQGGGVQPHPGGRRHGAVGRHPRARPEADEVADHQPVGGPLDQPTVAPHLDGRRGERLQRLQGALGAGSLDHLQSGVDDHDRDDREALDRDAFGTFQRPSAHVEGQRAEQQQHQRAADRGDEATPAGRRLRAGQGVRPGGFQTAIRFGLREPRRVGIGLGHRPHDTEPPADGVRRFSDEHGRQASVAAPPRAP